MSQTGDKHWSSDPRSDGPTLKVYGNTIILRALDLKKQGINRNFAKKNI